MMKSFLGEVLGTCVLVFLGCFSVAAAVLFHWFSALWQVALIWSLAVFLGIIVSRKWCHSHLNPAVTLSMVAIGHLNEMTKVVVYIFGQFVGAFLAAAMLFVFVDYMEGYSRGFDLISAMTFGEYYPNPDLKTTMSITWWQAGIAEGLGTAVLLWIILETERWKIDEKWLKPAIIGLTVGMIIMLVADYTQAGLNPARDFGPRLFSYLAGWKQQAFSQGFGTIVVYVLSPVIGGVLASILHQDVVFKTSSPTSNS